MEESSLKEKTIRGVSWSAADAFLGQGVTFIVGVVLARILSPDEYGLIGIVAIFTNVMFGIVDCGFSNSLIRKLKVTDEDYSTLFFFNLSVSGVLFAIIYYCAPWIAVFFERPQLEDLLRVMGLILIIQALYIVQNTILSRRIDFKTKTKASVVSAASSGAIGIAFAYLGFGVWSLVAQQISRQAIHAICLWIFNQWWPKLRFSMNSLKYMWGFGWKLLLSGLLENIWKELYQAIVGKFYSPSTLGQYTRAKEYSNLFSYNFTSIIQRVSYPALSQIQDDELRLVCAFRRIIKCTMFVSAICLFGIAAISEPLIYCLIGPNWHLASTYLPLICISMSLYPLHAINLSMLQVQGRTDIFLFLEIVKKIIALGPICLGIFISIYWMLIGTIIAGIVSFFFNSYYSGKRLGYSSWMQIKDIAPSYMIAIIFALCIYFFKFLPISYWLILPIQICIGIIVLYLVCERTKLDEYIEVRTMISQYLSKIIK